VVQKNPAGHNDIDEMKGNIEQITGKLQKSYGYAKEQAEKEYKEFKDSLHTSDHSQDKLN